MNIRHPLTEDPNKGWCKQGLLRTGPDRQNFWLYRGFGSIVALVTTKPELLPGLLKF